MTRRIDAGLARKVVALLRARQLPAEPVVARAGLDMTTLGRQGARIPFAAHVALLEHAAAAARDPCLGLHLGAALQPRDLGLVGYLGATRQRLARCSVFRGSTCAYSPRGRGSKSIQWASRCESHSTSSTPPAPAAGSLPTWCEQPGPGCPAPHRHDARAGLDRAAVRQLRRRGRAPPRVRGASSPGPAAHRRRAGTATARVARRWRRPRPVRSPRAGLPRAAGGAARPAGSPRSDGERDHGALTLQHALSRPRRPAPWHHRSLALSASGRGGNEL